MSCHGNDEKKKNKDGHNSMPHMLLMMVLCCSIPILLILAFTVFNIQYTGLMVSLVSVITFLCPLMMLFMIPMMLKGSKEDKSSHDKIDKQL